MVDALCFIHTTITILRGRVTTSVGNGRDRSLPLIDIIEIATMSERHFAMTNEDCDTVSFAGVPCRAALLIKIAL